ncbi:haloalkane dehalogenase [Chitinophaga dinghuensis]|uniref:Haloalkane dehalogenase n=1 Tax=Chitinophaga dinghuensis TaxID=1539050 RepID=A0A327W258_9BACT|nr:haloalkane dehalogenase [Chitinophaga dinghuensis]RAJ82285.1 haloalkane dehalogenase [Chitinophaga dinghuensis]
MEHIANVLPVIGEKPFAEKKYIEIKGHRMAYIDEGQGDPIVFQHGNPTSSYLWRNIMPYCNGLGRLIACDLIGMGDSGKLPGSNPERYSYEEQRHFLFALWEELKLDKNVILVLHDWGSVLGFDWASQHRSRVQGIVHMEALAMPFKWDEFEPKMRDLFKALRSPAGEELVLQNNVFVDKVLPAGIFRQLSDAEMAEYRRPFLQEGEDRRPTLSFPRQITLDGTPKDVTEVVTAFGDWLQQSAVPKLWIHGDPGAVENDSVRAFCRTWPNQSEITVRGKHFLQEDSPHEIGAAIAAFVKELRQVSNH